MNHRVGSVAIVGGGTAGWMSALYLNRALGRDVKITVVESPTVGTIGVGEATFNTIKSYFDYCGLPEQAWMPACNATYKMAIKFVDWTASGPSFFHPFQRYHDVKGVDLPEWWLKNQRLSERFDYACFTVPGLCDAKSSPKYWDGTVFDETARYPYAYHFDANLLADFLQEVAIARGVEHIYADVRNVSLGSRGEIATLLLADGRTLTADLFLDCTGFRGLLINGALGEPFIPFSNSLLCDRAVAMRIPTPEGERDIRPYTTATALTAGWVWDIPLYGRVGTGYVYSSDFLAEEEAEKEFRSHLGPKAEDVEAFHISMRIGRTRRPWVKNCVSVGLSGGFVEPLESTGIFFIQYALAELLNHFPRNREDDAVIHSYNRAVGSCIDGVRDFLFLHYYANDRRDTAFWNAVKDDVDIPNGLRDRLDLWKNRLPNATSVNAEYHGFAPYSYCVMLLGLNYRPKKSLPILDYLDDCDAEEAFSKIRERSRQLRRELPSQHEYLSVLHMA